MVYIRFRKALLNMEEGKKFRSITDYFNMLNMIYYVLVAIPLILFLIVYLDQKEILSDNGFLRSEQMYFKLALALIVPLEVIAGELIFKNRMERDFSELFLQTKLHHYFQASLIGYAAYFTASLIAVVALYFFVEGLLVGLYMIVLFSFSLIRPTKKRIVGIGIFTDQEIRTINKEDIIP